MSEPLAVITGTFAHAVAIKTRSTFQLIIEIPIEGTDSAISTLGGWPQPGKEKAVAIALLNPNRTLAAGPDAFKPLPRTSLAQLAGILCGDEQFQGFISRNYAHIDADASTITDEKTLCAAKLRAITGVDSRKEFDTDHRAGHRFIMLKEAFDAWSA